MKRCDRGKEQASRQHNLSLVISVILRFLLPFLFVQCVLMQFLLLFYDIFYKQSCNMYQNNNQPFYKMYEISYDS